MCAAKPVVLVTGAANGIGAAVAERFGADGYAVALGDIDEDGLEQRIDELQQNGTDAHGVQVDVSDSTAVDRLIEEVVEEFGRIDVLVNNAGIVTRREFLDLPEDEWDRVIAVNLRGPYLVSQRVAEHMIDHTIEGAIVNVTSIHQTVPRRFATHYDASKGGAWMLTQDMALELAEHGINVNAVAPGAVKTPMNQPILDDEELYQNTIDRIPAGRLAEPEEIAGVVRFLASDEAEYVTGSHLTIDGGLSLVTLE